MLYNKTLSDNNATTLSLTVRDYIADRSRSYQLLARRCRVIAERFCHTEKNGKIRDFISVELESRSCPDVEFTINIYFDRKSTSDLITDCPVIGYQVIIFEVTGFEYDDETGDMYNDYREVHRIAKPLLRHFDDLRSGWDEALKYFWRYAFANNLAH